MAKKLYTESSVQSIANALRKKNSINDAQYKLAEMTDAIYSLPQRPTEIMPEYVRTESARLAEVVKSHQTNNGLSFIAVADMHDSQTSIGDNIALRDCALGAYLVRQLVPIDFAIFLGDYIRGRVGVDTEQTSKVQFANAMRYTSYFADAMTQGNHDNGMAGLIDDFVFTTTDVYNRIGRNAINVVRPVEEADRGYYYFDVPGKDFRVIVLNTNDMKGIAFKPHSETNSYNDGHRVSVPQLQWLANTLAAIPAGYHFIVCSHEPIHWADYTYTDANGVAWDMAQNWRTVLDAYCGGTSYSFAQDGQTVSGDFSSAHNGVCCGTYHGHTHNFIDGTYGNSNIVRCSTPNACNGRTNEYGGTSYPDTFRQKFGELKSDGTQETAYFKTTEGTAKDTAFVVNTIDFDNMILYSDYYGAGRNRMIKLSVASEWSITATIGDHITSTDIPATVAEGHSLSVTLTPDTDYTAKVTVKMGGTDVTSTAYSNGTISIASVTADVVITALAVFTGNYVPVVGYTDDKRWSASTGNASDASGYTAVNVISFDRETDETISFVLSGIDWTHDATRCVFVATKDGALISSAYLKTSFSNKNTGIAISADVSSVTITFTDPEQSTYDGINGFKVSGYGSGADAVIKLGEQ